MIGVNFIPAKVYCKQEIVLLGDSLMSGYGLDEEFHEMRNERDKCIKESIAAGKRFGNRGGSLKKKENDNKLTKKKLIKKRQKQRGRTRRRKYF